MSIGAAIGGLVQGFAQGAKLKSDLEDAETRRGLMGLQAKQAQLAVDTGEEQAAARKEAASFIKGYNAGDTNLGFIRNEDGSYDPNLPQNIARNYELQEQSAQRVALAHGQNPTKAIAEVRELRKNGFQEGVNQAAALYGIGDLDAGDAVLKKVYPMIRDGQTFLGSQAVENDPNKVALRYKVDKTGEEKTLVTNREDLAKRLLPMAMNITDAANYNLRTQELGLKKEEMENLQEWRKVQERLTGRELDIKDFSAKSLASYHTTMGQAALARANTEKDMVNLNKQTQALNNQLGSITTLLGIDKNFDPNKASAADIAEHKDKLATANTAMYLVNQGIDKGKLTIDATQAIQLAQAANSVPFSEIKRDGPGLFSTTIKGVKIPIGMTEAQYNTLAKANAPKTAPAAAPAAAQPGPGIKTPGNISLIETETREIERGLRRDYSPQAKAEMQAADLAEQQARADALAQEQQRQLAAGRGIAAQYRN